MFLFFSPFFFAMNFVLTDFEVDDLLTLQVTPEPFHVIDFVLVKSIREDEDEIIAKLIEIFDQGYPLEFCLFFIFFFFLDILYNLKKCM